MIENNIPGTLLIWPGVAEEILGSKAWYVRVVILMMSIYVFLLM